MKKTSKHELLQLAYAQTDKCSLLNYDCAVLCGGICCKSHAVDRDVTGGMSLLPEESKLCNFAGAEVKNCADGDILVCSGKCDRQLRPFMCRIFPYYAKITLSTKNQRSKISLLPDPRAFGMCPVARKSKKVRTSIYFRRYTKRAVRILLQDEDFKNEFLKHSEFSDNLYQLYARML